MRELTLGQARRIALAAQGFDTPRPVPGTVTTRALLRVLERVGCVQVDSVNVLVRSHYLPFFARLGGYDLALLDRLRDDAPRRVVEYWAHEASLLPVAQWPLHGHRMRDAAERAWGRMRRIEAEHPGLADAVEHLVRAQGPLTARQVEAALTHPAAGLARPREHWGWNWSHAKVALEWLFWCGRISSAGRTAQFERRYAAPEHVAPPAHRAAWTDPARAVRILRNAIAADPYVPNYYSWAVVILYRQQRYKECREMLDLAQQMGFHRDRLEAGNAAFRSIMANERFGRKIPD